MTSAAPLTKARAHNVAANDLLNPYRLGSLELANRIVMAPMTRSRALAGNVPNPLAVTYYAQRASAGLIVTEATQVSRKVLVTSARPVFTPPSRSMPGKL